MASGGIPDVGVRLTAQGVQDVINAFTRVRQEAKTTGEQTSASFNLITSAASSLVSLLPAITFAGVVAGVAKLAEGARETTENMGKLSEKTGAAVGTLSVLNLVAHDSEVDQDTFSKGLIKLAKNMQDASDGAAKPTKAFKALGITVADLKNQDPGQMFVTVAQKLDALPPGAQKAQIAIALFGKAGAELIPMLDSLGVDGFDKALAKAQKLGLFLDGDMVASARAAQDAFHELEDIATGLGTRFVAGFAPQFTSGIEILAEGLMGKGVNAVQTFGDITGQIFKALTLDLLVIIDTMKFVFTSMVDGVKNAYGTSKAFLSGLSAGGPVAAVAGVVDYAQNGAGADYSARQDQRRSDYVGSIKTIRSEANQPIARTSSNNRNGSGAGGDGDEAAQAKLATAQSEYEQSLADNKLALLKTTNQLAEAEDKRHYDAGLITVDDYYDGVEARITSNAAAELAALQEKMTAAEAMPQATAEQSFKRLEDIGKIQTQMAEVSLNETAAVAAAESDRSKAKHDNALKELDDQEKLQKASGDTFGAEQTQLKIELQQYSELLEKRKDLTDEQREAMVLSATVKGTAKIGYGENNQELNGMMQGMNQDIGAVQDQANSGQITQISAETQILAIETQRLATMKTLAEVMLEQAKDSGDVALQQQAKASIANIDHLTASLKNATSAQTYLINQLSTQGISALTNFFTAGISGSKSFGDALGDLANSFANIVAQMVSQLLIFYALQEVLGLAGVDSGTITSIIGTSPFSKGHEQGGYTANVGKSQVAGVVHGGEWVATADQTLKYRPLFDMIMNGTLDSAMSAATVTPRISMSTLPSDYANSVSSSGGSGSGVSGLQVPAPIVQVVNNTGQQTKQTQQSSPGGQSITSIIIGAVATDIARGGQVAQAMQANYGVARQGVKRG